MKTAKFELKELLGIGFTIVVLGIAFGYGMDVIYDVRSDNLDTSHVGCNDTAHAYWNCSDNSAFVNATSDSMSGVTNLSSKIPTIMTVVVASVIIGILVTYLWMRFSQ